MPSAMYGVWFPDRHRGPADGSPFPRYLAGPLPVVARRLATLRKAYPRAMANGSLRRADGSIVGNPTRPARLP
jgi:hypothetical protein